MPNRLPHPTPRGDYEPATTYTVKAPDTLMNFLLHCMHGISRSKVKSMLHSRSVRVDRQVVSQFDYPLTPGMQVAVARAKRGSEFRHPLLRLVYEDPYLLVVEKKEGLLSVSTTLQKERTAHHLLTDYVRRSRPHARVYVVHRLDRETSGLMMYAKDEQTWHTLREQWHDIVTDRRYVAVVSGSMQPPAGTIESWLLDKRLYVASTPYEVEGSKFAITHYRTLRSDDTYSLLELQLETGRKNQIRVHVAQKGHPIVGDARYGSTDDPLGRMCLHAFKLCFYHPATGELMQFETPYPPEFKRLVK